MKDNYIIVSFATKDGVYDKYGEEFELNMKKIGVPYDIEYIEPIKPDVPNDRLLDFQRQKKDTGRIRGKFLLRKMDEHRDKIVVWMDCDDGLVKKPVIKDTNFDVGFVKTERSAKHLPVMARLLILNQTLNARHFLKVWDYLNAWPELEPMGGSHLRLCHAREICFSSISRSVGYNLARANLKNKCFKEKDFTEVFRPILKIRR